MQSTYETPSFQIALPEGSVEDSIHVVRLPRGPRPAGAFQPSVVIKRERAAQPIDIDKRGVQQVDALAKELAGFNLIDRKRLQHQGLDATLLVYDWGKDRGGPIRQKQLLVRSASGLELHVLTASDTRATFAGTEPVIDALFATFAPRSAP